MISTIYDPMTDWHLPCLAKRADAERAPRTFSGRWSNVKQDERILVGTDFSEGSALALETARGLAQRLEAGLDVLHVVERYGEASWRTDDVATAWLSRCGLEVTDVVIRTGFPWVEMVRYAHETTPTMIVVGSHGTSGFQPLALGSTAARMGVLSPFPVLVVTGSPASRRSIRQQAVL